MGRRTDPVRETAQALKFAQFRAQGLTRVEAWRRVFPKSAQIGTDSEYVAASKFAARPLVKAKELEVLQTAILAAQMNPVRFLADTQDLKDWCIEQKNPNAAVAAQRLIGQAAAVLRDNVSLTAEHRFVAEKHINDLIALGIPAEQARALLPKTGFGSSEDETKH